MNIWCTVWCGRCDKSCCLLRLLSLWGDWSQHAEEETQWWLTQRHQRCGRACSRPRSALETDLRSIARGGGGHRSLRARLTAYMDNLPAGRAGLGKLLSLTSTHGVKILRQTVGVNCQIMSSTSPCSLRFHCKCLSRPPFFFKKLLASVFVCECVSTVSTLRCYLWSVFWIKRGIQHAPYFCCYIFLLKEKYDKFHSEEEFQPKVQ